MHVVRGRDDMRPEIKEVVDKTIQEDIAQEQKRRRKRNPGY